MVIILELFITVCIFKLESRQASKVLYTGQIPIMLRNVKSKSTCVTITQRKKMS